MRILAIESSCDETAAAIIEDGRKILSSVINTQVAEHGLYGGVVPEIASRRHTENIVAVAEKALADADMTLEEVDHIAVTAAPGLIGALLVGVNFAKGLSLATGKKLIPVHHLKGHIAANYLAHPELKPPFLCLVVSGGHSHIVEVSDYTKFRILGKTRDDAAGEAFDKAARAMGLPYPGGVHLDRVSKEGNPKAFNLPKPKVEGCPLDMSFSGLKTAVVNILHNAEQRGEEINIPDLCASYQDVICHALCAYGCTLAVRLLTEQCLPRRKADIKQSLPPAEFPQTAVFAHCLKENANAAILNFLFRLLNFAGIMRP